VFGCLVRVLGQYVAGHRSDIHRNGWSQYQRFAQADLRWAATNPGESSLGGRRRSRVVTFATAARRGEKPVLRLWQVRVRMLVTDEPHTLLAGRRIEAVRRRFITVGAI